jgi:hypothetical protein
MGWIQIFIHGNTGCGPDIMRQMAHSNIIHMPGTIAEDENVGLYWVDEKTTMRAFKKGIGSKTIWKHRLRFFTSLEKLNEYYECETGESFTPQEKALINSMEDSRFRNSA